MISGSTLLAVHAGDPKIDVDGLFLKTIFWKTVFRKSVFGPVPIHYSGILIESLLTTELVDCYGHHKLFIIHLLLGLTFSYCVISVMLFYVTVKIPRKGRRNRHFLCQTVVFDSGKGGVTEVSAQVRWWWADESMLDRAAG